MLMRTVTLTQDGTIAITAEDMQALNMRPGQNFVFRNRSSIASRSRSTSGVSHVIYDCEGASQILDLHGQQTSLYFRPLL
jgi:hypothetical protein